MQFDNLKFFSGNVNDDSFELSRTVVFRRFSFIPIIEGNIIDNGDHRLISVSMHYHAFVFGFMAIWFIFVVIGCIGILFQKNDSMPFIFRFILYYVLFGALIVIKYKVEANIVKNKLIELLQ